jgi:hypothetical protein
VGCRKPPVQHRTPTQKQSYRRYQFERCLLFQLQRIPINLFAAHEHLLNIAGVVDILGWIALDKE